MVFNIVSTTIALLVLNSASVNANWLPWKNDIDEEAVSLNELQSFWVDAIDIISDLESYDKLWIKPHSCVWSECAVDDTDDGYMGDNRDGDEQWYQYRTQGFCANAAYSVYGKKKEDKFSFVGCTRRHFINSFFTYGGADNLLKSIGESPIVYSHNNGDDDNNNDDNDGSSENANCVEIEYEGSDDYANNYDEEGDDNSNSGSNDDGYSGTLGCDAEGNYVIAAFQSSSCDGNYFAGVLDDFTDYNSQHNSVGCHKIYENSAEVSTDNVMMLLNNSWSCDLRLYPNGCPDPYGIKKKFDFALRTVNQGGNPQRAYRNMVLKTPLHIISWTMFALSSLLLVIAYLVKNESRAIESKGGKSLKGYLFCLIEDISIGFQNFRSSTARKYRRFVAKVLKKKRKRKKSTKTKKKRSADRESSSDSSRPDADADADADAYVHVDDDDDVEKKSWTQY